MLLKHTVVDLDIYYCVLAQNIYSSSDAKTAELYTFLLLVAKYVAKCTDPVQSNYLPLSHKHGS